MYCFLISNNFKCSTRKRFLLCFIDSNGQQISKVTQLLVDGLDYLQYIRDLAQDGKINEAFTKIKDFKENNKTKILYSDIMILYSELALKNQSKKLLLETSVELEKAINSSLISQQDLLKAYMILVDLKLGVKNWRCKVFFKNNYRKFWWWNLQKLMKKYLFQKFISIKKIMKKATKTLFEILSSTKDKQVATVVGNELFDIYLLQGKNEEAKS